MRYKVAFRISPLIELKARSRQLLRVEPGRLKRRATDQVAAEEPLEIRVDTRPIAVTMRTPGQDRELAAGFLLSEGIIGSREDLKAVRHSTRNHRRNVIEVFLADTVRVDFSQLTRHVFASSSCGLCGKATIDAVHRRFPPIPTSTRPEKRRRAGGGPGDHSTQSLPLALPAAELSRLPDRMRRSQSVFEQTGGLHSAAVFDTRGGLVVLREDIGRHNAVDKVLGWALWTNHLPLDRCILLVSGRASFEIVQKGLAARIPIIAAISAPSSLAVDFARSSGQTLIGFLRDGRMNIYTHPARITV